MMLRDRIAHAWAAAFVVALASGAVLGPWRVSAQTVGDPRTAQPNVTEPGAVQPTPVEPTRIEPAPATPPAVQPGPVDPGRPAPVVRPAPEESAAERLETIEEGANPPAATGAQIEEPEVTEHEPAGMPQLNPETFAPQLVWLAITFLVLYLLMSRVALPRIGAVLDERKERISADLDKASQLRQEAEAVLAEYEEGLTSARGEAQRISRTVGEEIAAAAAAAQAELARDLAEHTREAETRIAAAKQQALENVRSIAVEVAQAATAKLIGEQVTGSELEDAVDAAVRQRG